MSPTRSVASDHRTAFVSVGKVALVFGVTPATVRNWISKGYVHALTLPSGHHRISETEVRRLVGAMGDPGRPVTEDDEGLPQVTGSMVSQDEDWGPGGP
jgi:hypothetical protein